MHTISIADVTGREGPKYRVVADMMRERIATGALKPGDKLPPVRDLAWQLQITPGTVARAYTILTDEGACEAVVGRGTFVAAPRRSDPERGHPDIDPMPHGSEGRVGPISMTIPAIPEVGQGELIARLMKDVAGNPPSGLLHYPTRMAFKPVREAVVGWLDNIPLGPLSEEDVVLSHGGQNGILLVLQAVLTGRKPVVLVEELAYPGFRRAAEMLRAEVIAVPMDERGIIPDALDTIAAAHDAQVLCTTPEQHNPTTTFTPEARRRALAEVAARHNVQFLEDACYCLTDPRAPTYRQIAPERSWFVSSISKILTPSLRVGFAIAPPGQGGKLRQAAEHGFFGLATPLADLVAKLLPHPETPILAQKVRDMYARYMEVAREELAGHDVHWQPGTPFLWLVLPDGWRSAAFCQAAEAEGVRVRAAEDYAMRNARAPHAVRISVNAWVPVDAYRAAVRKLTKLLDTPPELTL